MIYFVKIIIVEGKWLKVNFFLNYWYFIILLLFLFILIIFEIRYFILINIKIKSYKNQKEAIWNDNYITLSDNYNINYFSNFLPNMKTIIIGVHGLGCDKNDFKLAAKYFSEKNIGIFSFDQRGFGDNLNWKYKNLGIIIDDINEIAKLIKNKYPNVKIVLLGESLGAALCGWMNIYGYNIDGIILSNFVTNFYPIKTDKAVFLQILMGLIFNSSKMINLSFDPKLISNNKEYIKLTNERFVKNKGVNIKLLLQTRYMSKRIPKIIAVQNDNQLPILVIQSKEDIFSSFKQITKNEKLWNQENVTFRILAQGKHALLNEPNNIQLFDICFQWITMKIEVDGGN